MESIQQIEAGHGGPRLGAGRPKGRVRDVDKWMAARGISPLTASEVLNSHGEMRGWARLLQCKDDGIFLKTWLFLVSMRDGRPAQQINVTSRNITMSVSDLERARDIIREIRGESLTSQPNPKLGLEQGGGEGVNSEVVSRGDIVVTSKEKANIMLSSDEGGKQGG